MDVGAGREGALPCSGEDRGAHAIVGLEMIEARQQAVDQSVIQGVEFFGAVERQHRDAVADLAKHRFGHVISFPAWSAAAKDRLSACLYIH